MTSTTALTGVIRQLQPLGDAADGELLARYAQRQDEAAFAAVVRRYGGLVLGVARRQLADGHRAEDVFQATFLALARAAGQLDSQRSLANWLYTVALRNARKARVRAARQEPGHISLSVAEPHLALPAVLNRVESLGQSLASLTTRHASLEDVFVALTGRRISEEDG